MSDIPAQLQQMLELRYDGPIPAQHMETAQAKRRRRRGILSVLETQAAQFLDAAERCQGDMEDIAADLADGSLAPWQRKINERRLQSNRERCNAHVLAAAETLRQAMALRHELGLIPHPIVALTGLIGEPQNQEI